MRRGSKRPRLERCAKIAQAVAVPVAASFADEVALAEVRVWDATIERVAVGGRKASEEACCGALAELRRSDVQALVDELVRRGLSGSPVHGILNALRAVLRRPLKADQFLVNPTERLDLPAGAQIRQRAASPVEAAALLDALPLEDRALWATAFYAGLRRGELRALRCSDIDEAVTEIRVQRGWDDVEGAIEPKSQKGIRRVPVAAALPLILL
jgi:integrase